MTLQNFTHVKVGFRDLKRSPDHYWHFENPFISFCAHQSSRDHMEDRMHCFCNPSTSFSIFSIFDGHGGDSVSDYLEQIYSSFMSDKIAKNVPSIKNPEYSDALRETISDAIHIIDKDIEIKETARIYTGSTLCSAIIQNNKYLTISNIGDSRAVACDSAGNFVTLTRDHKPTDADEKQRIEAAGGHITQKGDDVERVMGILAMTRSVGDAGLKARKYLIVDPDITIFDLEECQFRYLIIGSDGLFDVFEDDELIETSNAFLQSHGNESFSKLSSHLCSKAIDRHTEDNVSVLAIKLFL